MSALQAARIYPLSPDGAAAGTLWPGAGINLVDLTANPRFGVKGSGSSAWLEKSAGPLPLVNALAWVTKSEWTPAK